MNVFFDTEFTGLKKDTTLVSIGLVTETDETFYAELTDWDRTHLKDEWFKKNVYDNLIFGDGKSSFALSRIADKQILGDKKYVAKELSNWLYKYKTVELYSDVCHYDMVLFIDLFGTAFDLPKNICPACYDINQDIAAYYERVEFVHQFSMKGAFDMNRESLLKALGGKPVTGAKHNSLYDAKVIKSLYDRLKDLK